MPDFSEMISEIWPLKQRLGYVSNIYSDAANPVVWQAIKREADEPFDEKTVREKKANAIKNKLVSLSVKVRQPSKTSVKW